MTKKILAATLGLLFTFSAHSSLLLEPYLGYIISGSGDRATTPATEVDYSGVAFGARVGVDYFGVMAGFEYSLTPSTDYEFKAGTTTTTEAYKGSAMGVFVGYNLPVLVRVWGTYFFNAEAEDDDGSDAGDTLSGSGFALGVGYTGLPFLSINLEMRKFTYDENEDVSAGSTTTLTNEFEMTELMLSVSFPINI